MYSKKTNLVFGFHGCDKDIRDIVINGGELKPSLNSYDWLGNGIYFWEADPQRALEWAKQAALRKSSSVKTPAVLGAIIDLGNCLDLMNRQSIPMLQYGYEWLKISYKKQYKSLPQNKNVKNNADMLYRDLDCAVIQKIHELATKNPNMMPFDSVRGLFIEGKEPYAGSGFREKTHIQLCIVNPNCTKGYFLPRKLNSEYQIP